MATGPMFGSIAALFGYTHDFITRTQYTELVTVVEEEEALGAEEVSIVRHVTVGPDGRSSASRADDSGEPSGRSARSRAVP